jgi:hypothetical protein
LWVAATSSVEASRAPLAKDMGRSRTAPMWRLRCRARGRRRGPPLGAGRLGAAGRNDRPVTGGACPRGPRHAGASKPPASGPRRAAKTLGAAHRGVVEEPSMAVVIVLWQQAHTNSVAGAHPERHALAPRRSRPAAGLPAKRHALSPAPGTRPGWRAGPAGRRGRRPRRRASFGPGALDAAHDAQPGSRP